MKVHRRSELEFQEHVDAQQRTHEQLHERQLKQHAKLVEEITDAHEAHVKRDQETAKATAKVAKKAGATVEASPKIPEPQLPPEPQPVEPVTFEPTAFTARQVKERETVDTQWGAAIAEPGTWVVTQDNGPAVVVHRDDFEREYVKA